jgi:glycerophosphoryl diester phosphodiesterase
MKPVLLIHHSANRGPLHPPGSLPGLKTCLEARARVIELDLSLTADGDFALLHGPLLEDGTTGSGPVDRLTAAEIAALSHVWHGRDTGTSVGLLGDALALLDQYPDTQELQLDLKPYGPPGPPALARLADRLQPVKQRVRVTSGADWLVRYLHALDPDLPLGFDPLLYLDLRWEEGGDRDAPPFREGAYGYRDEHPLASERWGTAAEYLTARAEALWAQAPPGAVWYIRGRVLARALDDGFDWIDDLHRRGAEVDAWTLDPDKPGALALARRLVARGVDRITTNDAPGLGRALGEVAVW